MKQDEQIRENKIAVAFHRGKKTFRKAHEPCRVDGNGQYDGRGRYCRKKRKVPRIEEQNHEEPSQHARERLDRSPEFAVGEEVAEGGTRAGENLAGVGVVCILVTTEVRSTRSRHNWSLTQ